MPAILRAAPFAHGGGSITRTMTLVMVALMPTTAYGVYLFGWPALNLFVVTIAAAILFEAICLKIAGKPVAFGVMDGSAVLSGWLLALTLPPWAPWWIGAVGAFVAIVFAKHVFGGVGQNLFNPAMVARVVLLISFPLEMTSWLSPRPLGTDGAPGFREGLDITFLKGYDLDAVSSASILGHVKTELGQGNTLTEALSGTYGWFDMTLGNAPGSMGETSVLLILLGGLFLIATRIISWSIPVSMIATIAACAGLANLIAPEAYPGAIIHVVSGATLLGAFFIATDYVTSPSTLRGQLIFGAGVGLLAWVIRTWAGYPEGVAFAVLLMNACTPLIDRWITPRVFGRTAKGDPLDYDEKELEGRFND
ncbi:MAG: RnfABCDGE type electron transport complex subunit D [Magnetovibrionaceae bacterium]